MKEIIPEIAEISMDDSSTLKIKLLPKSKIDAVAARQIIESASKVSGGKKHFNLVDTSEMLFMDETARKLFAQQDKSTVIAVGVVINSRFQRSIANLYLKFSKPFIPTKMFDYESEAISWFRSLK